MDRTDTAIVVTTIREPTSCMVSLAEKARAERLQWIVIGDKKGPERFNLEPAELITLAEQKELDFRLARLLPEKHYARKNLGYLIAISRGCNCIYETDDDNAPTRHWRIRSLESVGRRVNSDGGWLNIYRAYTSEFIWPRGLPLTLARNGGQPEIVYHQADMRERAPIQQGLANGSPDVDAVWRLLLDRSVTFNPGSPSFLPRGTWCPFNSQNTWWWEEAFPLLYLPSFCSFRMTDIWRSLVAQRCLWELGFELAFHSADVVQMRNEHDLMSDFRDEVVGYLRNDEIRLLLEDLVLSEGPKNLKGNMAICYEALEKVDVVPEEELPLLYAWLDNF